jgi:hypothetical protein
MRRILWAFVILSPVIAIAQSYGWSLSSVPSGHHLTQAAVTTATMQLAYAAHAVRFLLG